MNEQPDDVRAFVRDIGVRAAVVGVGGLIVTGSLAVLTRKGVSGVVKRALGTTIAMTCGGVAGWGMEKNKEQQEGARKRPGPLARLKKPTQKAPATNAPTRAPPHAPPPPGPGAL